MRTIMSAGNVTTMEVDILKPNLFLINLPFCFSRFVFIATNAVCRQLHDLSNKIAVTLRTIFVSKKLWQDLKPKEVKPSIAIQHCVVYKFACDLPCSESFFLWYSGFSLSSKNNIWFGLIQFDLSTRLVRHVFPAIRLLLLLSTHYRRQIFSYR